MNYTDDDLFPGPSFNGPTGGVEDADVSAAECPSCDRRVATTELVAGDGHCATCDEQFRFLNYLRQSGAINMFEAPRYLMDVFNTTRVEAMRIFIAWSEKAR